MRSIVEGVWISLYLSIILFIHPIRRHSVNMYKTPIAYCKPTIINLEVLCEQYRQNPDVIESEQTPNDYNPYRVRDLQLYNPIYRKFFEMNDTNYNTIALNHPYHVQDLKHVATHNKTQLLERDVFVKFSPLLDPYRYMVGKYNIHDSKIRTMPRFDSTDESVSSKILCRHNAAYVDSFFTYLSSTLLHSHNFHHGLDYYGSYLGVQDKFRVCITDDLDFLRNSTFFNDNVGKLFYVEDPEHVFDGLDQIAGSRRNKQKLTVNECDDLNIECDALSELDIDILAENIDVTAVLKLNSEDASLPEEAEMVYSKRSNPSSPSSSSSQSSSSDSDINYSSSEDDEDEDDDENTDEDEDDSDDEDEDDDEDDDEDSDDSDEDTEEEEVFGYINNFPVQMICMEKCDGTLDELFVNDEISIENGASYLFQIIMSLLIYQKAFNLTHNDLHTNNIMYTKTDKPFLYYKYAGKSYKVPTYGRILKIIDFGRGIYKYQGKTFCSDSFAPDGDASTQYNMEPFLNKKRPVLEANYSFDLCRLGSSIFDFIMDVDVKVGEMDDLQKTIHRWCMDDNGKNVLYKKNGEERYPSFKLYKMIARTVHAHTPESQLEHPYFNQFFTKESENGSQMVLDIDQIPSYV